MGERVTGGGMLRGWGGGRAQVGRDLAMGSVDHIIKYHVAMVRNALVLGYGNSSNIIYVYI